MTRYSSLSVGLCHILFLASAYSETAVVTQESSQVLVGQKVVATLDKGQQVTVVKRNGYWTGVAWTDGSGELKKGWVRSKEIAVAAPKSDKIAAADDKDEPKVTKSEAVVQSSIVSTVAVTESTDPAIQVETTSVDESEPEKVVKPTEQRSDPIPGKSASTDTAKVEVTSVEKQNVDDVGSSKPEVAVTEKRAGLPAELNKEFSIPKKKSDPHGNPVNRGVDETTGWPMEIVHKSTGIHFVFIPAGEFLMGSPDDEKDRVEMEGPQHNVTLTKPYYLGKYEVTQAECKKAKIRIKCRKSGDDLPVEQISWGDCVKEIKRLNSEAGLSDELHFTLPTEAQWEYACRAGTTTRFFFGDDPDYKECVEYMWFGDNSKRRPNPVGKRKPNPWGLYDMAGNVLEWCHDRMGPMSEGDVTDPTGPVEGETYVNRGGYWNGEPREGRSACRAAAVVHRRIGFLGFRLCISY